MLWGRYSPLSFPPGGGARTRRSACDAPPSPPTPTGPVVPLNATAFNVSTCPAALEARLWAASTQPVLASKYSIRCADIWAFFWPASFLMAIVFGIGIPVLFFRLIRISSKFVVFVLYRPFLSDLEDGVSAAEAFILTVDYILALLIAVQVIVPLAKPLVPCVVPLVPCAVPLVPCVIPLVPCVVSLVPCVVPLVPCVVPLVPSVVPLVPCVLPLVPCV